MKGRALTKLFYITKKVEDIECETSNFAKQVYKQADIQQVCKLCKFGRSRWRGGEGRVSTFHFVMNQLEPPYENPVLYIVRALNFIWMFH